MSVIVYADFSSPDGYLASRRTDALADADPQLTDPRRYLYRHDSAR